MRRRHNREDTVTISPNLLSQVGVCPLKKTHTHKNMFFTLSWYHTHGSSFFFIISCEVRCYSSQVPPDNSIRDLDYRKSAHYVPWIKFPLASPSDRDLGRGYTRFLGIFYEMRKDVVSLCPVQGTETGMIRIYFEKFIASTRYCEEVLCKEFPGCVFYFRYNYLYIRSYINLKLKQIIINLIFNSFMNYKLDVPSNLVYYLII